MRKNFCGLILILILAACGKSSPPPAITPDAALLVLPLKDQACTSGTVISKTESSVNFSWTGGQNTDSYELTIKNLLTQTIVTQTTPATNVSVTLLRNTPFEWFVTSKYSKTSIVTSSNKWKFYNAGTGMLSYAPFPAEILTPTFGQILSSSSPTVNLTWKGSAVDNNIVAYSVYFGPNNNPGLFRDHITDSFVNSVTVGANTTYYWRVITIDAYGNISDSGLNNFYVK